MSEDAALAERLARLLTATWREPVTVDAVTVSSAGATRRNVFFDAHRPDGRRVELVATVVPAAATRGHTIEDEAACLRLAADAGVPCPRVQAIDDTPGHDPVMVTDRVVGATVPRQVLRLVAADPALGSRLGAQCGTALARLHATDPGLTAATMSGWIADPASLPPGLAPAEAALADLERGLTTLLQPSPTLRLAWRWLAGRIPPPPPTPTLVHGDFRNGNLVVSDEGLVAVLDWELAHRGDPMEDLAWLCQRMWRFRNDDREVGGFTDRLDLVDAYRAAGGRWRPDAFEWWTVACCLRWGLGLARQARGHLEGAHRSIVLAASGRRVAEIEWDLLMAIRPD